MLLPFLGKHCTAVDTKATISACGRLSSSAANSMKGRFTDMLPFKPGRETFIRDAAAEQTTKQAKRTRLTDSQRIMPAPIVTRAQRATRPTKTFAVFGMRFM